METKKQQKQLKNNAINVSMSNEDTSTFSQRTNDLATFCGFSFLSGIRVCGVCYEMINDSYGQVCILDRDGSHGGSEK